MPLFHSVLPKNETLPLFAESGGIPGETLSLWWTLPFGGMLASLALVPLVASHFWEAHYGKVALGWSLITLFSLLLTFDVSLVKVEVFGTLLHHYLPFIIVIGALYTISGGIQINVESDATPAVNTGIMVIGTILAGWIGTTGASMLLIRPLLHVNRNRKHRVHQMIFFIFLVANIGGALTPLGDPPLFLGFLNGVSFFWPMEFLFLELVGMAFPLLFVFYLLDSFFVKREGLSLQNTRVRFSLQGEWNGLLFFGVIGLVLLSGVWKSSLAIDIGGVDFEFQNLVRDTGLVLLALISWYFTPLAIHKANNFSWEPLKEVAKLFFGIFMTVIPVIAILDASVEGALSPLVSLVSHEGQPQNAMYFWLTGGLSAVLDNAPTYLVFFHMAGGDAPLLMTSLSQTLVAISLGSVFMGAMTYIGNAPNFMVKTIAESHQIKMPSFFGYMVWSLVVLIPFFLLLAWWQF